MALKIFKRVPWWMWIVSAVFVLYFSLQTYGFLLGPANSGLTLDLEAERPVVIGVEEDSEASRAGFKTGDIILTRDGKSIRGRLEQRVIRPNLEIGQVIRFVVERDGQRIDLTLRVERMKIFADPQYGVSAVWQLAGLFLLACALLIAFSRPSDRLARWGALALGTMSIGLWSTNYPPGFAVTWRALPRIVEILFWIPNICLFILGPILLTFFVLFPRPLFRVRWPWVLIWLPALGLAPLLFYYTFLIVYSPEQAFSRLPPMWVDHIQVGFFAVCGLSSLGVLTAKYFRLADLNEKRRLTVLLTGGAAGVLPSLLRLLLLSILPQSALQRFLFSKPIDFSIALIFVLFPICFAYSILRYRLLDIKVMIRRGLQYALARNTLISAVPVLAVILALDLTLHSRLPLTEVLKARGWIYVGLVGLALVSYWRRKPWLEKLDKRFFREQYNAQQILASVLEDIQEAKSFERVSPRVAARIEAALHPEFVSVMKHEPNERQYHAIFGPFGLYHTRPGCRQ